MTVKELREKLKDFDDDLIILVSAQCGGWDEADQVKPVIVRPNECTSDFDGKWTSFHVKEEDNKKTGLAIWTLIDNDI